MKVMIARCPAAHGQASLTGQRALGDLLRQGGHQVQFLDLPAIGSGMEALTNIASHRLLNLSGCDVLLCLDRVAAVLRHGRKFACLLDRRPELDGPEADFLGKLLNSALGEAQSVPAPAKRTKKPATSGGEWAPLLRRLGA
jgi:hypothetical protein